MCGIAGIVDLGLERTIDRSALERMTAALYHRGPDEVGFHVQQGLGLGSRRLSIIDIADSQQPVYNEAGNVVTVFNGELFDYVENRAALRARGHRLSTSGDTETLVHLWEDFGEDMFSHINGQFAFALFDSERRTLILARDRIGIRPLHWTRVGNWLLFGSEIKALLASNLVPVAADPLGLNHMFTFYCTPSRRTTFRDIWSLDPGCYLKIQFGARGEVANVQERRYWDFDFPDWGAETRPASATEYIEELDEAFQRAVRIRMRADVPVAAYLSGGVDSALIMATAQRIGCAPVTSFTARIADPKLNETEPAMAIAKQLSCEQQIVNCDSDVLSELYPQVVVAADCPVVDPNSGALMALAQAVHESGLKVVLTGEGADEAFAGYVWFKAHKLARLAGWRGFQPVFNAFALVHRLKYRSAAPGTFWHIDDAIGGTHAQALVYHMASVIRWKLLSPEMHARLDGHCPYDDLGIDADRVRRWHPLNRSLYFGYKTNLAGLLLSHRGDRVAMSQSVEARFPFLDEKVIQLAAKIHPGWKLRGIRQDKYIMRRMAARYLPRQWAMRPKAMFRAPFKDTFFPTTRPYVQQLLTLESLRATPYFDAERVHGLYQRFQRGQHFQMPHAIFDEMALCNVLGTQLWHHLYLGGGLCELPTWSASTISRAENTARRTIA